MFGKCLKSYFSNLRYIFVALGVIFLGLLIGGSILIKGYHKSVDELSSDISSSTGYEISSEQLSDGIIDNIQDEIEGGGDIKSMDLDGDNLLSGDEIEDFIEESVTEAAVGEEMPEESILDKILTKIGNAVKEFLTRILLFLAIQVAALLLAQGLVHFFARSDVEHRNPVHVIWARLFHDVMVIVLVLLIVLAMVNIPRAGIVLLVLYPVLYCLLALFTANLCAGKDKRLPMKEALHIKNILFLLGMGVVEIILTVIIGFLILECANALIAFYIFMSLIIVMFASLSLNADTLIYGMIGVKADSIAEK